MRICAMSCRNGPHRTYTFLAANRAQKVYHVECCLRTIRPTWVAPKAERVGALRQTNLRKTPWSSRSAKEKDVFRIRAALEKTHVDEAHFTFAFASQKRKEDGEDIDEMSFKTRPPIASSLWYCPTIHPDRGNPTCISPGEAIPFNRQVFPGSMEGKPPLFPSVYTMIAADMDEDHRRTQEEPQDRTKDDRSCREGWRGS